MRLILALSALALAFGASAAHLTADPFPAAAITAGDTISAQAQCDSGAIVGIPAPLDSGGNAVVLFDLSTLPAGVHKCALAWVSTLWGSSPMSAPLSFNSAPPGTATGLKVVR